MKTNNLISYEKTILQQIILDELEIGDTIPSVRNLQARLGLSRNSVLAALRSLQKKNIILKGDSPRQGYTLCQKIDTTSTPYTDREITVQYLLPFTTWNYTINKYLSSFENAFSRHGINLVFSNTHNSVEEERHILESIYAKPSSTQPDYLFLTTCDSTTNPNVSLLQDICAQIPLVLIDRYIHGIKTHYIGVCNSSIGTQTANHLLQKNHYHIAYIKAYNKISPIQDRFLSFRNTLEENGVALDPQNIFTFTRTNIGSITDIQSEVDSIGTQLLSLSPRPSAVVCSFDRIAVALINFLLKNSIRIPEDICVIGCDNDVDVSTMSPLSLTTFRHPYHECAREAIQCIESIQNGSATPHSAEYFSELLIGASTDFTR
ncbi:MAG TPA: substrate-binding domain-containing protein [Clostridiales bacterium]|nr:substrate-binding domain-containing protein [Clostridiales bacterium]